jgi:invasion protein IalB
MKAIDPMRFPVERCEPNGCRAGTKLEQEFMNALSHTDHMTVKFHDAQRRPIEVPVSLKGLADGLAELKKTNPAVQVAP